MSALEDEKISCEQKEISATSYPKDMMSFQREDYRLLLWKVYSAITVLHQFLNVLTMKKSHDLAI